jgi:hypothetical protein
MALPKGPWSKSTVHYFWARRWIERKECWRINHYKGKIKWIFELSLGFWHLAVSNLLLCPAQPSLPFPL